MSFLASEREVTITVEEAPPEVPAIIPPAPTPPPPITVAPGITVSPPITVTPPPAPAVERVPIPPPEVPAAEIPLELILLGLGALALGGAAAAVILSERR